MSRPSLPQQASAPVAQESRISPPLNYRYLHRGSLLMLTPQGLLRVDVYEPRSFERLSLSN